MPKDTAIVDVALRIDLKDSGLDEFKRELTNATKNVSLPDNLKRQISDMISQVGELQKALTNLSRTQVSKVEFGNLKSNILNQISALDQRTSALETTVSSLLGTLSSADNSAFSNMLKTLRENMDQTATATKGLIDTIDSVSAATNGKNIVKIIDNNSLRNDLKELRNIEKQIEGAINRDFEPIKLKFKTPDDAQKMYDDLIDKYTDASEKLSEMKPNMAGYREALKDVADFGQKIQEVVDAIHLQFIATDFDFSKDIELNFKTVIRELNNYLPQVKSEIESVRRELGTADAYPKFDPQTKQGGGFTIPIDISTKGRTLAQRAINIISVAQSSVDGHPLEVELKLISPAQTKKANAALKEFQDQVGKISNDEIRGRMEEVVANIQKGFGSEISVKLVSSINDAAKAIRFILNDLKNEIKSNPVVINPKLKFTDEEISNMKQQVEDVSKDLSKKLADSVKDGFTGKEEKQDETKKKKKVDQTEFARLQKQLSAIITDINAIPTKLDDVTGKLPESITKIGTSLSELYTQFKDLGIIGNETANPLEGMFLNTGVDQFAEQLLKIEKPIEQLSALGERLSLLPKDLLKDSFSNVDAVGDGINDIANSLKELLSVYKEINGFSTPGLSDLLHDYESASYYATVRRDESSIKKVQQYKENYPRLFDVNSESYLGTFNLRGNDYESWADNVSAAAKRAGTSIKELGKIQEDTQSIKIDLQTEQFDKILKNTTTLKNSLNSLRKETKLDGIVEPLNEIKSALLEFSEVVQKSTGILSSSKLDKQFDEMRIAAQKLEGVKLNTKNGKLAANDILQSYEDYLSHGGEKSIEDLNGPKNLQKYLIKHRDENIAQQVKEETESLEEVAVYAEIAAEAKEKFSRANRELFESIVNSVSQLDNEGKAFVNINKLLNNVANEKGTEKLEKLKKALSDIIDLLNTEVGADSFIKSLENMATTGDALKDLATVLKTSQKRVDQAKKNFGVPRNDVLSFDYAQENLNENEETIAKAGREYLSQYGLVLESVINKNRDGLIQFVGLVKDANNNLKQFTLTSADGNRFNIQEEATNSPRSMKKAMEYERIRRAWQKMNETQENGRFTNEVVFHPDMLDDDREAWESMIAVAEQYKDEIGDIQKVTRQVRQAGGPNGPLEESFSFFGSKGHITMGREGGIVASHQDLANAEELKQAYSSLLSTANNYYELKMKASAGKASSYELQQLDAIENKYQELLAQVQRFNNEFGNANIGQSALDDYRFQISKRFDDYLQKSQNTYTRKVEQIGELTRSNQMNDYTPEFKKRLEDVANAYREIERARETHSKGEEWNEQELITVYQYLKQIDEAYDGIKDKRNILAKTDAVDNLISKVAKDLNDNSMSMDLTKRYRELLDYLSNVRKGGEDAAEGLSAINQIDFAKAVASAKELHAELEKAGSGKGFWKQFSSAITSKSANFLAQYFSLQDLIRYGREISQTVITIDSANTELKKVSGETNDRIQQSFTKSAQTAQELGATISEVINSTADWSRLGYDIDQAEELARVTTLYQTVGDNMTQESASESLVSMLQGFHIDPKNAERVIDSVNEVANNFAIDTSGIGEALQRSAAAFSAANTDLNKSIALVTTANAVVQDPASVGEFAPT